MKRLSLTLFAFVLAATTSLGIAWAQGSAKAKHSNKEVMVQAHKKGLLKKVLSGGASQADKLQLLDLYVSLRENEPSKGDSESWHRLNDAILLAAAKVAVGREGAEAGLKKATNCLACHKLHRPS